MTATLFSASLLAQGRGWDGHMDWGGGWWIAMILGMAVFWGLVLVGIVWLIRGWPARGHAGGELDQRPSEILERRLAEGEISVEEYEERRRVLLGSTGGGSPAHGQGPASEGA